MKKKMMGIALALMLAFFLCAPSFAADDPGKETRYVTDTYGLLSLDDWTALEKRAADISERYRCGVYIFTVGDYENYGYGDVYDVAAQIYHDSDNSFGAGDGRDGIMLLLSMNSRDYALFACGEKGEYAFNDYALGQLEDVFLDDFGNDNWPGGFSGYLSACEQYLASAQEGKPVRAAPTVPIVISILISCAIALVVCLILKGQMETVYQKNDAREFIATSGLHLTQQVDQYTHTTKTRRKIETKSENSRSSGGGGGGRSGRF